jgi:hypothetical protein
LLVGIAINVNLWFSWSYLLFVFVQGEAMGLAVLLVTLEGSDLILLGGLGQIAVAIVDLGAQDIHRLFLVLNALTHCLLGLIQVVAGYLLWGAQRSVGDACRCLALALLPLVQDQLLYATKKCFLVKRLSVVLVRQQFENYLICHILISRFQLVAVNTAINSSFKV